MAGADAGPASRPVSAKSATAFRTIGEVATELGIAQHVLRYWEGRFPQLRPLQRAGNRRYYRPEDVALVRRIHRLLDAEGYTVRGVQQLLAQGDTAAPAPAITAPPAAPPVAEHLASTMAAPADLVPALRAIRDDLRRALADDDARSPPRSS